MQIDLSIYDRLILTGRVLPSEGSLDEVLTTYRLRHKLKITEEEAERCGLRKDASGSYQWRQGATAPLACTLSEEELGVIRKGFALLAARERLLSDDRFLRLYARLADDPASLGLDLETLQAHAETHPNGTSDPS